MGDDVRHLGAEGGPVPDAHFVRLSETEFASTLHSQGAWQPGEQHMGAASGVILHEVERRHPREDMAISRISFDILGVIHGGRFTVDTKVLRPGRTIELIEATLRHGERVAIRALVWRLVTSDTRAYAVTDSPALPPVEEAEPLTLSEIWGGGFIDSLSSRRAGGVESGRGRVWLRPGHPLVEGEPAMGIAPMIGVVDVANGVSLRLDPREVLYPNVDLGIHLFRTPESGWLGIDAQVSLGPDGRGVTSSVLHDARGPFGSAAQSLTVRPRRRG